tara:strand:+ start:214 stop:537 length:324 start_codon:yes stop_codon:yes gene_type:complete
MENFLLKALVEDGGMWGIMAALSFFWALYVGKISRQKQEDVIQRIERQSGKIRELELSKTEKLEEINKINEERVEDLKTLLEDYHKTMNDTAIALENIRFILENKKV